jgi:hypothetical protein
MIVMSRRQATDLDAGLPERTAVDMAHADVRVGHAVPRALIHDLLILRHGCGTPQRRAPFYSMSHKKIRARWDSTADLGLFI